MVFSVDFRGGGKSLWDKGLYRKEFFAIFCGRTSRPRASSVVTLSEHSAGDINRLLNVPLEKIRIIPASVDAPVAEKDRIDVRRKFNIKGRILLYVGRRDPYKNLAGPVRAFALIKRNASKPVCLVIATAARRSFPGTGERGRTSWPG